MARRSLAAAILGLSLWVGSLAWSGFIMTRTVLDPDRSQSVAEALFDDEAVRAQLADNMAKVVADRLPAEAGVERAAIEAGADQALESPEIEALFTAAFVDTHRAFLGEGDPPESVDGGAFGEAARSALVAQRPELDGVLPPAPSLEIPLPTDHVPDAGPVRRGLLAAVPIMAAAAVAGVLLALVVTSNRPAIIRRTGAWAIALASLGLLVAYGVPWAAREWAPDQAEVIAALIGALAEAARAPSVALAAAGVGAVIVSLLWRPARAAVGSALDSPDPAPAPPRRRQRSPRAPRRDVPTPGRRPSGGAMPSTRPGPPPVPSPTSDSGTQILHPGDGFAPQNETPSDSGTQILHPGDGFVPQNEIADASNAEVPERARWVDGVGWVHDGADGVPDGARWVPGVGYVLSPVRDD